MDPITRRQFLKGSLAMAGYACCSAAFGNLGSRVAYAQSAAGNGNIFVVIHLDGGCDWHLSFDVAKNNAARTAFEATHPTSAVNASLVLPTANGYGFHPSLAALHTMYNAGDVRVIRRAGTKNPSRSHESEQLKFENGDVDINGLGWMGRVMDTAASKGGAITRFMTMAIDQGNPIDIQGTKHRGLGVRDLTSYSLNSQDGYDQPYRQYIARRVLQGNQETVPLVNSAGEGQKAMYASIATLRAAAQGFTGRPLNGNPTRGVHYPTRRPGPQLRQIAMLIQASLGTQLALCGMGGFDLHSQIGNETGNLANLMRDLDYALAAFHADMVQFGRWNKVVLAIDSEFGRTIQENGSQGCDHGSAIAQVLIGGAVKGGVTGAAVTGDEFLRNNNRPNWLPVKYHYANAYEEALAYIGLPSKGVFGEHEKVSLGLF